MKRYYCVAELVGTCGFYIDAESEEEVSKIIEKGNYGTDELYVEIDRVHINQLEEETGKTFAPSNLRLI